MVLVQVLLGQHWSRLAMPEIPRRRADQLGYFMRVLEFGTVYLDYSVGLAEEDFGRCFDHPRLARSGRTKKQHCPYRPARILHARQEYLIQVGDPPDSSFLAYDQSRQLVFKFLGPGALLFRVEGYPTLSLLLCLFPGTSLLTKSGTEPASARSTPERRSHPSLHCQITYYIDVTWTGDVGFAGTTIITSAPGVHAWGPLLTALL